MDPIIAIIKTGFVYAAAVLGLGLLSERASVMPANRLNAAASQGTNLLQNVSLEGGGPNTAI